MRPCVSEHLSLLSGPHPSKQTKTKNNQYSCSSYWKKRAVQSFLLSKVLNFAETTLIKNGDPTEWLNFIYQFGQQNMIDVNLKNIY